MQERNMPTELSIYDVKDNRKIIEKSLIAIDKKSGCIDAFGNDVSDNMMEYDIEGKIVISPFRQGQIDDLKLASKLIEKLLEKVFGHKYRKPLFGSGDFAVVYNNSLTIVNLKAYEDLFLMCGAKRVLLIEKGKEMDERATFEEVIDYVKKKEKSVAVIIEVKETEM